ncbi:NADH-quinone oxidoreductase subunit N [Chitinophagaceae bacterium LB-8]|uniref:NADH-quinone oxidoreductase subunit N n=1 Tax=Paraflavisolibacter caeni TaxID=2982496 RepID=A0A9X2XPH1_9BACT|nr:NADH-quinone oxidoreductase subunit N [Paraflavisolibacter caeni]MCU7550874.1 NADH-quinone oxidoreductase subunit N [Paraflavisolibacter caeni]
MEINDFFILMKGELFLAVMIFLLLFIKVGKGMQNASLLTLIQVLLFVNFLVSLTFNREGVLFGDMFITNSLVAFQKSILSLGTFLISLLSTDWLKKHSHLPEFFLLMFSSLLGMFFLISSGNLLMFYLSLELATIPVAALANFDLEKRKSSEAAMKLILSSAFSSGILLFGISLFYGATGTINFSQLPGHINASAMQILAFVFLASAFGFKLSAVPFHFWTADVYEGSPIAVTSFLSVISKGSMAFIFLTVLYKVFQPLSEVWYALLMILSLATMFIGNLFALRQQNIKRFLAFSSIAQVGFILMGMSSNADMGLASVVYFVLIYVFSNLAAFGVVSVISAHTGKEHINDYKGLYQTNPFLSWTLALALFSLAGIPPTAGFFGKLFLLAAGASKGHYWFVIFAALNLVISLYYYLNIVRVMFMDKSRHPIQSIKNNRAANFALGICLAGIVLIGLVSWFYEYIQTLM